MERFVNGLRFDIKKDVKLHEPKTYAEALRKAFVSEEAIEDIKRETQMMSTESKADNLRYQSSNKKQKTGAKSVCNHCGGSHDTNQCRKRSGVCFGCGKEGHKVKDCPEARERNQAKRKGGCHGCGQEGHYVRDCPRKQGRNQTQTHGQPPKQNQQDRQQERPQNQRHYQQNQTYQSRGNQQNPPQGQHYNHGRNDQGGNQAGQQQNGRVFAITHQDVEAANHVVEVGPVKGEGLFQTFQMDAGVVNLVVRVPTSNHDNIGEGASSDLNYEVIALKSILLE
ncbi:hypothetical protein MRB53_017219 [Persea americana]|uniref:Uncharacterized protein n=1 Tax=Persea americana TaxID=3435 RepID=A0ACC2M4E9_PERAE|nr:hypothetical protein MRB53_017219 [Persea americana]